MKTKLVTICVLVLIVQVIPIQLQQGETVEQNNVDNSLNECLSDQRSSAVGVCFGKELLAKLNNYEEADTFSLANGVSFVRDEKTPRDIGAFLDKDPMDFRSILEDTSSLISKRSLHWDLGTVYPGLVMRIGPTLANGVLEFVIDPRMKDRAYQNHGEMTTGRLLARNLLVPFLLGLKFHISTLLPLLLGLVLLASKKAFLLAKVALLAVTLFSGAGSGYGGSYFGGLNSFAGPTLSSYVTSHENIGHYQPGHPTGAYQYRHPHPSEYYYKDSEDHTTGSPITPDELRDRLERLFVTKKEDRDDKIRNGRKFAWTPINGG